MVISGVVVSGAVNTPGSSEAVFSANLAIGHVGRAEGTSRGSGYIVGVQTLGAGRSGVVDGAEAAGGVDLGAGEALSATDVGLVGAGKGNRS